jgi:hypothetical protein
MELISIFQLDIADCIFFTSWHHGQLVCFVPYLFFCNGEFH